ncbi:MAG: MotA/TolQ/ExbB proton channel family protein [Methanosarcina mazei]|nr:MotA/TolQ/ExbB proton channel family protein [Methanosarcina mazei]
MKKIIFTILALSLTLFANETDLERAYAKEFAYLKAQKQMLEKRIKEVRSQNEKTLAEAKRDITLLQDKVLQKNALSEKLSDELFRVNQHSQIMVDDTAIIESVLMQATTTLKPYGITLSVDKARYQEALKTMFSATDALITKLSNVTSKEGVFYAKDGSEIKGQILSIGNIASYGIADNVVSALVPAGANKLKVWNAPESAQSAHAIKAGDVSVPLHIFLYENANKEIEDVIEKSAMDVIDSGGIIGWVIVVLGLIGLFLAVLRSFFLLSASSTTSTLAKDTLQELLSGGAEKALDFLKNKKGSTARLLKATVRNLDRNREHIEDIVAESILHESSRLDKFGSIILVMAGVAPLLGLLGTVTGMIATFDIITEFGTGDPKLLSSGISIALVTTELGLIVAIPLLMIGNLLGGWAERVKDHMEHSALHIINEYNKQK